MLGITVILTLFLPEHVCAAATNTPIELRPCYSFHAFDHLHNYGKQAEAAAASGVTVIYATGLGSDGYTGLPPADQWEAHCKDSRDYGVHAKSLGIQGVLGYLCATSIVGLDTFDANWPPDLRNAVNSPPSAWRQQDSNGNVLPSWYGGDYHPACMNHPDWQAYQRFMVGAQIAAGHDGIFFDNPTVHPKGCYCLHCMGRFIAFLREGGTDLKDISLDEARRYALDHPKDFKRFRCTIARDFLAAMGDHARSVDSAAVVTENNSLNRYDVLFSQCHEYAYNLYEMSKTEDFVVIEDMGSQPRILPDGATPECAPTYAQLRAIIHGKPLVAVTIAENDYHTPPNLVRLAMCEAAAHDTGYMLWSTWPEEQRGRMASLVRPCADWLREHAKLFNTSRPRRDVLVFLPFRRWVDTRDCAVTSMAQELTRANISYEVTSEDDFAVKLAESTLLLLENRSVCSEEELQQVKQFEGKGGRVIEATERHWPGILKKALVKPSLMIHGPSTVRGVVRDGNNASLVFLYNLNVERLSSFEDKVVPVNDATVEAFVPFKAIKNVRASSFEFPGTPAPVSYDAEETGTGTRIRYEVAPFEIGMLWIIEKAG